MTEFYWWEPFCFPAKLYEQMQVTVIISAAMPYEKGERYAYGEKVEVSAVYAIGSLITLILMFCLMRNIRKKKQAQQQKAQQRKRKLP